MQNPRKDWRRAVRPLLTVGIVMLFAVALVQTNRSLKRHIEAPVDNRYHTHPAALRSRAGDYLKWRLFGIPIPPSPAR